MRLSGFYLGCYFQTSKVEEEMLSSILESSDSSPTVMVGTGLVAHSPYKNLIVLSSQRQEDRNNPEELNSVLYMFSQSILWD